jgi:UDP-2,3-diacylglucosamine hydrolase
VPGFTAFVSDLHLAAERPAATRAFFGFLNGPARDADALYILGDLFEYWAGDDDLDDGVNLEVTRALRALARNQVPVHVMRGNRDFLLRDAFAEASGAHSLPDPCVIDLYGTKTLLMHGDLLCTQDWRYQRFRQVVRNRWVQRMFMRLPLSRRKEIIGGARRMSEGEKQAKLTQVMDVAQDAVEQAFRESGCVRLIHGHTHRPARHLHQLDGHVCERWVLSDWYRQGQYLKVTADGAEPVDVPFDGRQGAAAYP